jgi:hypothetical protein
MEQKTNKILSSLEATKGSRHHSPPFFDKLGSGHRSPPHFKINWEAGITAPPPLTNWEVGITAPPPESHWEAFVAFQKNSKYNVVEQERKKMPLQKN